MTDREKRQHVIEVLQEMVDWMQAANYIVAKPERIHALFYAIASIKTDLKYDLLYEGVDCNNCKNNWHRGDGSTYCATGDGICHYECEEPTTKNDLVVDCISRKSVIEEMEKRHAEGDYITKGFINSLPSVTPQLSSELDKNSKKDFGESDCISRADVNQVIEDYMDEQYHVLSDRTRERAHGAKIVGARINELSSVTPQEPRWIPVSEKLPNDRDWYLGIFKEPDTGWINPLPFICDYVGKETKATTKEFWILHGFTDREVRDCDYYFNLECVAWMPLPKAFEPQESEG